MCAEAPLPSPAPDAIADPDAAPRTDGEWTFDATPHAVREGLACLLKSPALASLGEEDRGTAELLLAEALNNVVEHAYARWTGDIRISLRSEGSHIQVRITDQGLPMPGGAPPRGELPEIEAQEDLPEGGFGWFLIRSLSEDLSYLRLGDSNALSFRIPVDNWTR
ncbi:ATP-binding protein [Stagnihabitans tardus]|uniref:ATP-binding protein n=1 Tax=Stagnihabitans tardus TaxID=2699202 RepID=A0AAE4YDX1_9RHOB|nr:ATP-binding protein [Stagnihabitans tardus]NBZ89543.1 ATP-binding protein [Stagnihabitans tardus]